MLWEAIWRNCSQRLPYLKFEPVKALHHERCGAFLAAVTWSRAHRFPGVPVYFCVQAAEKLPGHMDKPGDIYCI